LANIKDFMKKADDIYSKVELYNIKILEKIKNELDELAKPWHKRYKELADNEYVKEYIEIENKINYIYQLKRNVSGYYPK